MSLWRKPLLAARGYRAALGSTRESQNTQPSEVRFRAKLGDEPEIELALV
jgi:hypothetical protein